jgi:hypothetical protein
MRLACNNLLFATISCTALKYVQSSCFYGNIGTIIELVLGKV